MNRQLTFQERCKAFAARRGRFVDMLEDDDSSSLRSPVASVAASFDTLDDVANDDESGGVGVAGIGDLCVPSTAVGAASSSANPIEAIPPHVRGVPSTIIGAASLSTAKALPGPKTYENDAYISLRLSIAKQLRRSGVHLITSPPLRKQGKQEVLGPLDTWPAP
jgi:hypothetical protein